MFLFHLNLGFLLLSFSFSFVSFTMWMKWYIFSLVENVSIFVYFRENFFESGDLEAINTLYTKGQRWVEMDLLCAKANKSVEFWVNLGSNSIVLIARIIHKSHHSCSGFGLWKAISVQLCAIHSLISHFLFCFSICRWKCVWSLDAQKKKIIRKLLVLLVQGPCTLK